MTIVPNFILKRMYKSGSFRRLDLGVAFDLINILGSGELSRITSITLNGVVYGPEQISLIVDGNTIPAVDITEASPAGFSLNQVITCVVHDMEMSAGDYKIVLDVISREAGKVTLSVQDKLAA